MKETLKRRLDFNVIAFISVNSIKIYNKIITFE